MQPPRPLLGSFVVYRSHIPAHDLALALACEGKTVDEFPFDLLLLCGKRRLDKIARLEHDNIMARGWRIGALESFYSWMWVHYPDWQTNHPATVAPAACHCTTLLAGHTETCSYHKPTFSDERARNDLWGIERVEAKTREELNLDTLTPADGRAAYNAYMRTSTQQQIKR